jgi:hypothetical protein
MWPPMYRWSIAYKRGKTMNVIEVIHILMDPHLQDPVQIELNGMSVWSSPDSVQIDIYDPYLIQQIWERDDFFTQLRQVSTILHEAGKTVEIFYRKTHICTLGKHGHSFIMQVLGIDHVSLGNPFRVYQLLRVEMK